MGEEARDAAQRRIDQAREVYDRHGRVVHVVWVLAAVVVIAAGLAMTVFPGPALVVLPLGLAMLAVVFGWARRLLLFGADEGADALHVWRSASVAAKVLTVATLVVVAGAVVAAVRWW